MIDDLLARFGDLDQIAEVVYSSEDPDQGKPAVLVLIPHDAVSETELEELGIRAREVTTRILSTTVKASLEYRVAIEDGHPVTHEDEPRINLRWQKHIYGVPAATRLNGRTLTTALPSGPPADISLDT